MPIILDGGNRVEVSKFSENLINRRYYVSSEDFVKLLDLNGREMEELVDEVGNMVSFENIEKEFKIVDNREKLKNKKYLMVGYDDLYS